MKEHFVSPYNGVQTVRDFLYDMKIDISLKDWRCPSMVSQIYATLGLCAS
jgi:hypothetical protein